MMYDGPTTADYAFAAANDNQRKLEQLQQRMSMLEQGFAQILFEIRELREQNQQTAVGE